MTKSRKRSKRSAFDYLLDRSYNRGWRHGAMSALLVLAAILTVFWLSAAAHAQDAQPTITVESEPAASGRLKLSVDGNTGWWWPKPEAVKMLNALQAEQEFRLRLVPTLEARIDVCDYQTIKLKDAVETGTTMLHTQEVGLERRDSRIRDLELKLARKDRHMLWGALMGSGGVLVLGLVAALAL